MKKVQYLILIIISVFLTFFSIPLLFPQLSLLLQSAIINYHSPKIVSESPLPKAIKKCDWESVKLLSLNSIIIGSIRDSPEYVGAILVPSLNMNVPLANYTDNGTYTFGAGMLEPHYISSNSHLVIGAHNLGHKSCSALFTPLAFHSLTGRKVIITNFKIAKEYKIESKQVISPSDVEKPFEGSSDSISLITCTSNNKKRILINAKLIKQLSVNKLNNQVQNAIQQKYQINAVDKIHLNN